MYNKWKQPVYYDFDQKMTQEIMFHVISKLYNTGFIVVVITSDIGGGNTAFWTELKISYDINVFFPHPTDENLKVLVFGDVLTY